MEFYELKSLKPIFALMLSAFLVVAQEPPEASVPAPPATKSEAEAEAKKPRALKNSIAVILAGAAAGSAMGAGISKDKAKGAIFGAIAGGIAAVVFDRVTKDDPPGKI